jgi:hypothetical protein
MVLTDRPLEEGDIALALWREGGVDLWYDCLITAVKTDKQDGAVAAYTVQYLMGDEHEPREHRAPGQVRHGCVLDGLVAYTADGRRRRWPGHGIVEWRPTDGRRPSFGQVLAIVEERVRYRILLWQEKGGSAAVDVPREQLQLPDHDRLLAFFESARAETTETRRGAATGKRRREDAENADRLNAANNAAAIYASFSVYGTAYNMPALWQRPAAAPVEAPPDLYRLCALEFPKVPKARLLRRHDLLVQLFDVSRSALLTYPTDGLYAPLFPDCSGPDGASYDQVFLPPRQRIGRR